MIALAILALALCAAFGWLASRTAPDARTPALIVSAVFFAAALAFSVVWAAGGGR